MPSNAYTRVRRQGKATSQPKSRIDKVVDKMEEKVSNMEKCIVEIEEILKQAGAGR